MTWLLMGDFERGLIEFEWLWHCPGFPWCCCAAGLGRCAPFAGKTILLHAQLGLGDTLQFIRYVPLVKQRGGRVVVECQAILLPLLQSCAGIDQITAHGSPLPPFDIHAPLASLMRLMKTTPATIPAEVPYLHADLQRVEHWRRVLRGAWCVARGAEDEAQDEDARAMRHAPLATPFRIGIAWQGNPTHPDDRHRSIPLAAFASLARIDGVQLVSLQKGSGSEQIGQVDFPVIDLGNRFETFADTAAVIKNIDLVVTLDSAIAHCAAAVGAPVWVVLPIIVDWRWMLNREDTPWYPTMRLFRQKNWNDWNEVFLRITAEVQSLVISH